MITFFTTAKSFVGEARLRQYNAIGSWRQVHPDAEVLLFGQGEGYEQAVQDLGVIHVPGVETNAKGCPRIDSMFALAERHARHAIKAYLNCDIIVLDDILTAARRISFDRFLMIGERWELPVESPIDFAGDWEAGLRARLDSHGEPGRITAIDMFLYRGDFWGRVPPMVIGRAGYDNFLVYYCRREQVPVVDMTGHATIIHQKHGYSHLARGRQEVFEGVEAEENIRMAGGWEYLFTIEDADWRVTDTGVIRNYARNDSRRWAEACRTVDRSRGWRRYIPLWMREAAGECGVRWLQPRPVRCRHLAKFPLWLARRWVQGARAKER